MRCAARSLRRSRRASAGCRQFVQGLDCKTSRIARATPRRFIPRAWSANCERYSRATACSLVDSGAHRAFAGHYWESYEPRTYISATNLGPMGWAIAAATGVQCAAPQRRVAAITGDGCMRMSGMEVATAARYRLPIVFVVINNAALGNVWLRAHKLGATPDELTSLPDHDWAGFRPGARLSRRNGPRARRARFRLRARARERGAQRHRRQGRQGLHDSGARLGGGARRSFLP